MICSEDFNLIRVENSDTEFVVVARGSRGFVPVIASANCSVDLMGFSASKGNVPNEMRDKDRFSSYAISSDIEEYHQVEVALDEGAESSVYFYWKGTMPDDKGEFLHTCKISLRQIFEEIGSWEDASQEFFGWHLGPIVHQIERQNVYRIFEKKRYQQNRKRYESFITMFAMMGAVIATAVAVGVTADSFDLLRSWFAP
jgi:hypothetical protein